MSALKSASWGDIIDIYSNSKNSRLSFVGSKYKKRGYCYGCGLNTEFKLAKIINDDLSAQWNLSKGLRKSFDIRESSNCANCGSSKRSNFHARAICQVLAPNCKSLKQAVADDSFRKLNIAEINGCGALHKIIAGLPNLKYSEFMPTDKSIRSENLDNLSYPDNYFDAVVTSETMEHVPDWKLAMSEVHRVLKPGGSHVFTVPAILTRKTRIRATRVDGKVNKILESSHHGINRGQPDDYLVFTEFGSDFRRMLDELGFETKIYYRNLLYLSDPNLVFVSKKV